MGYEEYELLASYLLKNNKLSLYDIRKENLNDWICAIAVRYQEGALQFVPVEHRTKDFWKEVLTHNCKSDLCQEAIAEAIANDVENLEFVPDEKKTAELYFVAIKKDIKYFSQVPDNKKTPEMCSFVFKKDHCQFKHIPNDYKTIEMWFSAIEEDDTLFEYVPEEFKTAELCVSVLKKRIKKWEYEWEYEKERHYSFIKEWSKVWRDKLKELSSSFLDNVPETAFTDEFCDLLISFNISFFERIPDSYKTAELYVSMLKKLIEKSEHQSSRECSDELWELSCSFLDNVPETAFTDEFCDLLSSNISFFERIPDSHKTLELYFIAIKKDVNYFRRVPDKKKTIEMCLYAIKKDSSQLKYIPKTRDFWLELVKKDGQFLKKAPNELLSTEFLFELMKTDGTLLSYVPEDKRTLKICLEAVENNSDALEYVPVNLKEDIMEQLKK